MNESTSNRNLQSSFEDRFKALLTATSDVVYSVSPDWGLIYELDGHGFLQDDREATKDWKLRNVYLEDHDILDAAIARAIATKTVFHLEHRVKRTDGTIGWTSSRAVPILAEDGQIREWFGLASDITERKLAEESLKESREILEQQKRTYETITAGTPDLMYVFDLGYRFTYANRALLEMWGKTWDEAVGKGLLENGYEPWHAEMHEREINSIKATGKPVRGEVSFPHATLGIRLYDYILNPVFDEHGEVVAVSGTTRDVTDRDQWERQLKESAERLQAINEEFAAVNEELSASNEQILAVNQSLSEANEDILSAQQTIQEGKLALSQAIEAANFGTWYIHSQTREFITDARLKELFGYYPNEPLSIEQAIAQITEEYREFVSNKLENAIYNNGDYDVSYPVIGLHDNRLRWLRAIGNLIADASGAFSSFTGVVMDITEQKMDEIRKNDFMGMVSHELKTPLTSLSAYLQLLGMRSKNIQDETSLRAISQAIKQTKRMSDMINGFLEFSRLEAAKIILKHAPFDIADLIYEAKEEALMLYGTHKFIFEPVDSQIVNADRVKLGQVIANLVGNAVKYSRPESTVQISCVACNEEVKVSVKDEGLGMKRDELDKIFARFYRVDTNSLIAGFGIGLYVSSEIVKLHHGEIWAESEIGKGSVFSFTFPL
ncbi:PAS domain S-box protein [Pedobacter frigidisoli]|uniref:histidine kinase n=1 Tax=Pedobacter frigidisoli TaxID=2530455 RepID=A0A4R0P5G2_9SPHI|nr:PAS domain S-box protein [Pedobacter frigidisoli]TCD11046.1 PAS domain S-box protein [Pedobacter frigidisoli]